MTAFAPPGGDSAALKGTAALLARLGGELGGDERDTRTAVADGLGDWSGPRSDVFAHAGAGVQYQLHTAAHGCSAASDVLAHYARALQTATDDIAGYARQAQSLTTAARGHDGKPDRELSKELPGDLTELTEQADAARRTLARAAATAAQAIDALTAQVAPVSSHLTPDQIRRQVSGEFHFTGLIGSDGGRVSVDQAVALLAEAARTVPADAVNADGSVDYIMTGVLPSVPAKSTPPASVARWWHNLSPMQQNALLDTKYATIGNLDGVPAIDRDFANRKNLVHVKASLEQQINAIPKNRPIYQSGMPATAASVEADRQWRTWNAELDKLNSQLDALQKVSQAITSTTPAPHYLIGYQNIGNGRAIISTGNPDTADNVATYVPGVGTKASGIQGGVTRADAMYKSAALAGSTSTASIAWYGYDAPQSLIAARNANMAKTAAPQLDRFQSGLRATHDGTFHSTIVAHSYGTTVTGYAASHGHTLDIDDVVFVASPGVTVDHASDLHLHGGTHGSSDNTYATTAKYDPIRLAAGIDGGVPVDTDFGAHTFKSSPDRGHIWALGWNPSAHSNYWQPKNPSVHSMGQIIAGGGGDVH